MKLLNQSIKYLSISILIIIGVWGLFFFFNMADEIKENVDEGLENYKRQIIFKAHQDTTLLQQIDFDEAFYAIREINKTKALTFRDRYADTLIYVQDANDAAPRLDPVRMLTTAFEDDGRYYQLKIINPIVERDDLIHRLLINMLWLYALLIVTIVAINNMVLQRLWKPFYNLLRQIQNFRLGSGSKLPEIKTKTKEFHDLKIAVDTLLTHNIKIYEQQKQFIGNAAHELQTPLAIAQNQLELLIEKGDLQEEQVMELAATMGLIERMTKLNKSLLLLSKIQNKQFPDEQPVVLNKVVEQAVQDLSDIAEYKGVIFSIEQKSELTKNMNPSLAEILVSNLLRNALFHNIRGGEISVSLDGDSVSIRNRSEDGPLEAEHIFDRFYKSKSGRGSTGLGLAIVKAIADNYNISIRYDYRDGKHGFFLKF